MEKETFDSYEIFEIMFKEFTSLCTPVGSFSINREKRLNPAVLKCLNFLFETVESFTENLEKSNFLMEIFWPRYSSFLYRKLLHLNISKFDDETSNSILLMERRLYDNFVEFKKGIGLNIFFKTDFNNFIKETRIEKEQWQRLIEKYKEGDSEESGGSISYYFLS